MALFDSSDSPRQLGRKVIRDESDDTCGDVGRWVFAVTGDGRTQELANEPIRGLAADGRGGCAIIGDIRCADGRMGNRRYERVRTFVLYGC